MGERGVHSILLRFFFCSVGEVREGVSVGRPVCLSAAERPLSGVVVVVVVVAAVRWYVRWLLEDSGLGGGVSSGV